MFVENLNFLHKNNRRLYEIALECERDFKQSSLEVIQTRTEPTLQIIINGNPILIHSKFDPVREAERFIEQYQDSIDNYQHVFFYGIGLGYHIEAFMKKYPHISVTLYEPKPEVFYQFISNRDLKAISWHSIKNIFVETIEQDAIGYLREFMQEINGNLLFISLPAYERIFPEQFQQFSKLVKETVQEKRTGYHIKQAFGKRWILNSLLNLPWVFKTPNILANNHGVFEGKPIILVSAGPSLQDEYDNLRYIKENGLAYILAVGSANKALIAQNIYPDAVCTYDPQRHNHNVYRRMIDQGIAHIPMIFGTSVGYETLEKYQGPKLHMITSQDTVSAYYLDAHKNKQEFDFVDDAPSIAIVTFELLSKLKASMIILVGQNFAFRDQQYYSQDVEYKSRTIQLKEEDLANSLRVEDVHGNSILTNQGFNMMRRTLEEYIQVYSSQEVINTTKGGANINGAPFIPLEQIINECLTKKVVEEDWYKHISKKENDQVILANIKRMDRSTNEFFTLTDSLAAMLKEMQQSVQNEKKMTKLYGKLDRIVKKVMNNSFYQVYLLPVNRVQFELLSKKTQDIQLESNHSRKVELIISSIGGYFSKCLQDAHEFLPFIKEIHYQLEIELGTEWKEYTCNSGGLKFTGDWQSETFFLDESKLKKIDYYSTRQAGSKVEFNFFGTALRVLGWKKEGQAANFKITIDGKEEKVSLKEDAVNSREVLYEKRGLPNNMHTVVLETIEENEFTFSAVSLNRNGRLFHTEEVTTIDELEIGKRIRCQYIATYNKMGSFHGLGKENASFIPERSIATPNGDFYFIMVDQGTNGEKLLIADRVIQHSVTWETLDQAGVIFGNNVSIDDQEYFIRSLTGGRAYSDQNNEWDRYIMRSSLNGKIVPGDNKVWNGNRGSWCQEVPLPGVAGMEGLSNEEVSNRRVARGNPEYVYYKKFEGFWTVEISKIAGFRPVLEIKEIP